MKPTAHWAQGLHSLLLKRLERFSSLCSIQRELNSIRPLCSAQWGSKFLAELVCRGCVSIVPAEPYVEFEWVFKAAPRGIWYILISTSALHCVTGTEGRGKIRRHMSECKFIPS